MFRADNFVANEANIVTDKDSPKQLISLSVVQCNLATVSVIPAYIFVILKSFVSGKASIGRFGIIADK